MPWSVGEGLDVRDSGYLGRLSLPHLTHPSPPRQPQRTFGPLSPRSGPNVVGVLSDPRRSVSTTPLTGTTLSEQGKGQSGSPSGLSVTGDRVTHAVPPHSQVSGHGRRTGTLWTRSTLVLPSRPTTVQGGRPQPPVGPSPRDARVHPSRTVGVSAPPPSFRPTYHRPGPPSWTTGLPGPLSLTRTLADRRRV